MTSYGPPPQPPPPAGYGYPQQPYGPPAGPPPGAPPPFPVWPVVVVTLLFSLFGLIPAVIGSNRAAARREDSSRYWVAFVVSMLGALILYAIVFVVLVFVVFASTVAVVGTAISKLPTTSTAATTGPCAYTPDTDRNVFSPALPSDQDPTPTTDRTWQLTTSKGTVVVALDAANAPCAVQSIAHLTTRYFYDGTECTRSVDSGPYLLQCGDPLGSDDGPGYTFAAENTASADYAAGVVAMAPTGTGANGSQFVIVTQDSTGTLPKDYTVVGWVTSGLDLVTGIVAAGNDGSDPAGGGAPTTPVSIVTATVS